jgi:hypothetical protein
VGLDDLVEVFFIELIDYSHNEPIFLTRLCMKPLAVWLWLVCDSFRTGVVVGWPWLVGCLGGDLGKQRQKVSCMPQGERYPSWLA